MSLWAMGDFHLAFTVDKPMEVFDPVWKDHEKKIWKYVRKSVKDRDTIVITGDHSWGRNLPECEEDAKKTEKLNEEFKGRLEFLQNNYYTYEEYALVGTKGYCYEGKDSIEHFLKIRERECERLRISFERAKADGYQKFIMFLHYPPTTIGEQESPFTRMAEEYGADQVIYSHCHGQKRYDDSFKGMVNGIMYRLVSSDYLKFRPEKIM